MPFVFCIVNNFSLNEKFFNITKLTVISVHHNVFTVQLFTDMWVNLSITGQIISQ